MKWAKDSGTCEESEICEKIRRFFPNSGIVLAFFSDRFRACRSDRAKDLLENGSSLLEVRVFNKENELWFHRSTLGAPFAWRLAGELGCDPKHDFFETKQALDFDMTYEPYKNGELDEYGCLKIRSTVMGYYALPIEKSDGCVRVVNYIRYDESGVANVVDYRIKSFEQLEEEAK